MSPNNGIFWPSLLPNILAGNIGNQAGQKFTQLYLEYTDFNLILLFEEASNFSSFTVF